MAGLDPAIHVFFGEKEQTWITATSAVMTAPVCNQAGLLRYARNDGG
jgi:hypothetical protein